MYLSHFQYSNARVLLERLVMKSVFTKIQFQGTCTSLESFHFMQLYNSPHLRGKFCTFCSTCGATQRDCSTETETRRLALYFVLCMTNLHIIIQYNYQQCAHGYTTTATYLDSLNSQYLIIFD